MKLNNFLGKSWTKNALDLQQQGSGGGPLFLRWERKQKGPLRDVIRMSDDRREKKKSLKRQTFHFDTRPEKKKRDDPRFPKKNSFFFLAKVRRREENTLLLPHAKSQKKDLKPFSEKASNLGL